MNEFIDVNSANTEQDDNFRPADSDNATAISEQVNRAVELAMSVLHSRYVNDKKNANDDDKQINAKISTKIELEKENSLKKDVKYFYGFSENLLKLDLTPTEFKIIIHILDTLKWGNVVSMTQASIAAKTKISASVINRNWKTLINKKVLIIDENNSIYFNTNYFFIGLYQRMDKERRADFEKASVYDDVQIKHMHNSKGIKHE
ncbi:replication/maintenance protein RepL [Pseudomonas sp. O39]|uniref:replication/maintenance protein RepL n=1 Tax=Pseudomonas sp. O39 TaxID=3379130 RepID=UPI00387B68CC